MINSVGTDIVEISRIKALIDKYKDRFINRIFTEKEIANSKKKNLYVHLAGKFAAKEAVFKTLRTGWPFIPYKDIEIRNDELLGSPEVYLKGRAQLMAERQGITSILVSISHSSSYAIAFAISSK